jgi:DNA-binding transcriptional ArsR family regulator
MRYRGGHLYGGRMSVDAARAAEMLSQLSAPQRLAAYAELVRRGSEGATIAELAYVLDVPVQKSGELLARLVGAGLATGTGNGVYRANAGVLREAAAAVDKLQPISPLLASYPQLKGYFAHGRLTSLPPTLSERYDQVGELMVRFLALDGLVTEDELNALLAAVTDDVAGMRRMLVDTGWLERDRAGSTYGPGRKPESSSGVSATR